MDVSDAAAVISYVFKRGAERFSPPCLDACDCNDDSAVNLSDAICILQYSFGLGRFPPAPGPGLMLDESLDSVVETPPGVDTLYYDLLDCAAGSSCDPPFPLLEDCSNGADDDGDGLIDERDPDCSITFACGSRDLRADSPFPVEGSIGETVDVCFFVQNAEEGLRERRRAMRSRASRWRSSFAAIWRRRRRRMSPKRFSRPSIPISSAFWQITTRRTETGASSS